MAAERKGWIACAVHSLAAHGGRKAHWPTEIARALVNLADAVTTRDDSLDAVKVDGYRTLRK